MLLNQSPTLHTTLTDCNPTMNRIECWLLWLKYPGVRVNLCHQIPEFFITFYRSNKLLVYMAEVTLACPMKIKLVW